MQYGNKLSEISNDPQFIAFKSYYVVWKPERWKEIGEEKDEV